MTLTVTRFTDTWSDWDISWSYTPITGETIRLPVTFQVELGGQSSKVDCLIGQYKRGMSVIGGKDPDIFKDWTGDGPDGGSLWWDGSRSLAAELEWEGNVATFKDAPGFRGASRNQSLYMGDAKGGPDYFGFRTFVMDRSMTIIKEIEWYMRIDVPKPPKGKWWSFVQKRT